MYFVNFVQEIHVNNDDIQSITFVVLKKQLWYSKNDIWQFAQKDEIFSWFLLKSKTFKLSHLQISQNAQIFRYSNLRSPNFHTSILRIRRSSNFQTVKLFDQTSRIPICDLYKYSNTTRRVTMVKVANRSYQVQLAIVIDIDRRIRVICSHVNRNARKRKERKRQRGTSNK